MTAARATINQAQTGIWSALIEWPFGYRFVSAIDLQGLTARIDSVAFAIGRRIELVRGAGMKLSPTQERALAKLTDEPKSAYELQESLSTLQALIKRGRAKDVTPPGPGAMFSPTTHFKFVRRVEIIRGRS